MNFDNTRYIKDQKFENWFRNHYLKIILGILFIFTSLPVIAPVLLKGGLIFPANVIYWIDSFFCHQLPFRSWFLFGDQYYYPLASTGLKNIISFEDYFHPVAMKFETIRFFTGNSTGGYKIAICQRDIAMYISLFAFGLTFTINKRKIKKLPLWIWIVFGVIPLVFDGLTQYLGYFPNPLINNIARESTPLLRTITGSLFGVFTGWYIFPALESLINKNIQDKSEF